MNSFYKKILFLSLRQRFWIIMSLLLVSLVAIIAMSIVLKFKNTSGQDYFVESGCSTKTTVLANQEYIIPDTGLMINFPLLSSTTWKDNVKPVLLQKREFEYCEANAGKLAIYLTQKLDTPPENRQTIATLVFNFSVYVEKDTYEKYNADSAFQDIVNHIEVIREPSGRIRLIIPTSLASRRNNQYRLYDYRIMRVNDTDVTGLETVELLSQDGGANWTIIGTK